jgi:hypothetical protein
MGQEHSRPSPEQASDPNERYFADWVWIEFTERGERIWIESHGHPPRRDSTGKTSMRLCEAAAFFYAHSGDARKNVLEATFHFTPPGYDWRTYE